MCKRLKILKIISEPPAFITRPSDHMALAGEDVLLACQVNGDPQPDVHWKRQDRDLDVDKVKIVAGKGLKIESVHPSDEGTYICEAANVIGPISRGERNGFYEKMTTKPLSLAWLLTVAVISLHLGDLNAIGWGHDHR